MLKNMTKVTRLLAVYTMLGGVGVSSSTAFASTKTAGTTVRTTTIRKNKELGGSKSKNVQLANKDVMASFTSESQFSGTHLAKKSAWGVLGDIETYIGIYQKTYAGGVKFGKWLKKNHPEINKTIHQHPVLLGMAGLNSVFVDGYMKGSM